jgi:hypothetical protein
MEENSENKMNNRKSLFGGNILNGGNALNGGKFLKS